MFPIKQSFSSALAGAASAISGCFSKPKKVEKTQTRLEQLLQNCTESSKKQKPWIERESELKRRLGESKSLDTRLGMLAKVVKSASSIATSAPDKMPNLQDLLKQCDAIDVRLDELLKRVSPMQPPQTIQNQSIDFGAKFNPFSHNYDPAYEPNFIGEGASADEIRAYLKSQESTKTIKKSSKLETITSNLTKCLSSLVTTVIKVAHFVFKPVGDLISNLTIVKRYKNRTFIADLALKAEERIESARQKDEQRMALIFGDFKYQDFPSLSVVSDHQTVTSDKVREINTQAIEALFAEPKEVEDGEAFRALFSILKTEC